jgi:uncharacterized protein YlbG (UPF0298 family)
MSVAEKRGEPTIWNIMRSDINEAIRQSMTETQFYRKMQSWGYSFYLSPKRKYPTIRPAGYTKATRLNTLGDEYTRESIVRRILENEKPFVPKPYKSFKQTYRYKGVCPSRNSVTGVYVIYLIFQMLLRKIVNQNHVPDNPYKTRFTPEMREAVRRIQRYSKQTRLLCKHKIVTPEQLQRLIETKNNERKVFERERVRVYNKMKYAKTPEKLAELKSERDNLSAQIKVIRSDLFIANCAKKEHLEIRRKLLKQHEFDSRLLEIEKHQNKNKERGHIR